jgi:arginyl-tRNA synthetase
MCSLLLSCYLSLSHAHAPQNLAQEKVRLSLMMLNPDIAMHQVHMNYELVKLVTGRMSGRRGRYLLADDLYQCVVVVVVVCYQIYHQREREREWWLCDCGEQGETSG